MALQPGAQLGPYEILSAIGAGGMGEVYKARDTRLDRIVAIKVLPSHLAGRAELRERFDREARAIANLQHPHICVLYDIGEQDATAYLVMEYLEGETLEERLRKGPLPLDQVLQYAIEISDALDKAHRQGFTHRDIKPANMMLTKAGSKILDFGLAKLKQETQPVIPLSQLPTVGPGGPQGLGARPTGLTADGTIIGTLQYMAPEQVEGRVDDIDARTDIFSFGATVYEMATGKKAFEGKTAASVMAKILEVDPPPMSALQPMTPPTLDRVVKKCLAKDPDDRWQSARDLHDELLWIKEGGAQSAATTVALAPKSTWKRRLAFSAVGLAIWAITTAIVWYMRAPAPQRVTRLAITLPPGQHLAALDQPAIAISPDGKNLVYVAIQSRDSNGAGEVHSDAGSASPPPGGRGSDASTTQMLYLRPLDSDESRPIAGTEGAVSPFFSPDGQWIGFFAGGMLKKISVTGGAAVTLADAPGRPGGASWSSQGTVAVATESLQEVSQEGGVPHPLTRLGEGEQAHRWPEFLPDGRTMLFARSVRLLDWNNAQIAVQPSGTSEQKNLAQGSQPRYSSGHLLYLQGKILMAAPFDARRLALTGAAVPVLEGLRLSTTTGAAQYSISATGTLVYLAGGLAASQTQLVWVSRNGEEQPIPVSPRAYLFPRISPDGRRVAVQMASQIWAYDVSRDTLTRLSFGGNLNILPSWSPDGRRIAFASDRAGPLDLFWQSADGSGEAQRLTTSGHGNNPNSFSPDGRLLAFTEANPETRRDIWILKLSDREAQPFLRTPYEDTAPRFSPDGKWLAYSSDESGQREIYVQPYPGLGGKWQISNDGGQEPVWNPKGGELFYRSGSKIMAVDFDTSSGVSVGKPRMLFEGPYLPTATSFPWYDVSPDGQRFLMLKPVDSAASAPTQINVVLNWHQELLQKVPVK